MFENESSGERWTDRKNLVERRSDQWRRVRHQSAAVPTQGPDARPKSKSHERVVRRAVPQHVAIRSKLPPECVLCAVVLSVEALEWRFEALKLQPGGRDLCMVNGLLTPLPRGEDAVGICRTQQTSHHRQAKRIVGGVRIRSVGESLARLDNPGRHEGVDGRTDVPTLSGAPRPRDQTRGRERGDELLAALRSRRSEDRRSNDRPCRRKGLLVEGGHEFTLERECAWMVGAPGSISRIVTSSRIQD